MQRRVVVALHSEKDEFQRLQARDALAVGRALGVPVEVVWAGGFAIEQIHQLFQVVHTPEPERPAAIIVEPVAEDGFDRLARNALRAGIGWVSLNRSSPALVELRKEFRGLPVSSVSTDQVAVGRIQAEQARAHLGNAGRIFSITGPEHHTASRPRRQGLEAGLRDSRIEVSYDEGQWTVESGGRLMRNWLRPRSDGSLGFDLLLCQNDQMAAGARAVLLELQQADAARGGWSRVPCLGVDGLPDGGRAMVDRGDLAGTVVTPSNAGPAVEMVARWLERGEPVPPMVSLAPHAYPERIPDRDASGCWSREPAVGRSWRDPLKSALDDAGEASRAS